MAFANYGDWTDRIAKGELPFAKPSRPQGVERNIVVTLRDWMNEKQYLHDLIASDRRYPTVNAYGPLVGSPEYSSDTLPILDPVKNVATTFAAPVRDAQHAAQSWSRSCRGTRSAADRRPTGAVSASGRRASTTTTRCSAATGGSGWRHLCAVRRIRPPARQDRIIRRPRPSRWSAPSATSPCSISRRRNIRSSTPASRRITCSSATTRTRHSGRAEAVPSSAGSIRRCSTRRATPRSRRGGRRSCSTPTATGSAMPTSSPISRRTRPRTPGSTRPSIR